MCASMYMRGGKCSDVVTFIIVENVSTMCASVFVHVYVCTCVRVCLCMCVLYV